MGRAAVRTRVYLLSSCVIKIGRGDYIAESGERVILYVGMGLDDARGRGLGY